MYSTISQQFRKDFRWALALGSLASGILLSNPLYAQATPQWTSAVTYGGGGSDIGQAVKVDPDKNRYVTGAFSATASFPGQAVGQTNDPALTSAGGTDVFLAKYDKLGKLLWLTQAGGSGDDEGFDIAFDAAENVYVAGMFTDSATFRGVNGSQKTVTGVGETIFLAKYTPSGALVWVQTGTVGSDSSNNGYGVAIEPGSQSVYVTGVTQGDTTFSSSDGTTHTLSGPFTWHMFLVKFDTAGKFHWAQSNEAVVNSVAHKVAVDAQANAYVTGWMEGQSTFHSNNGHDLTVPGFSGPIQSAPDFPNDAFIVKYDHNGDALWVNHIGGYKAIGTDVATSANGQVSITGIIGNLGNSAPEQASTIVTSQPGGKNINLGGGILTNPFNRDVFVATYNGTGVLLGAQRFGGAQDDGGSGIAYDSAGNLIVAGIFQGSITIKGHTLTGKDTFNLFVAKFARVGGGVDWAAEADGPGIDGFENDPRIGLTSGGDVLVTGAYEPSAQFGHLTLQSAGLEDGFLALLGAAAFE